MRSLFAWIPGNLPTPPKGYKWEIRGHGGRGWEVRLDGGSKVYYHRIPGAYSNKEEIRWRNVVSAAKGCLRKYDGDRYERDRIRKDMSLVNKYLVKEEDDG